MSYGGRGATGCCCYGGTAEEGEGAGRSYCDAGDSSWDAVAADAAAFAAAAAAEDAAAAAAVDACNSCIVPDI